MEMDIKSWMQSHGVIILELPVKKVPSGEKPAAKPKPEEKLKRTSVETEAKKEQEPSQSQSVPPEEGTESTEKEQ